jgi:hypothetical protein
LPDVQAVHLLGMLNSMGWVQASGMGIGALSATEIYSWCQLTATQLMPWEFEAIKAASSAFAAQSQSEDKTEPNPPTP